MGDCNRAMLLRACAVVLAAAAGGCLATRDRTADRDVLNETATADIASYVATVAKIKYESGDDRQPPAQLAQEPRRLAVVRDIRDLPENQIWRMTLADAQRTALASTAIVRDRNQFLSPGNSLLTNGDATPSAYDVHIQQSGLRSVDAALAAFSPRLTTGAQWGSNALIQGNGSGAGSYPQSDIFVSDNGSFYARLDQPLQSGAQLSLVHNWNYTLNNLPSRSFNSQFAGFLRGEFRQPLWAGSGSEFTDIAGPQSYRTRSLGRGVVVARIDENISLAEFESRLNALLKQTEELYWDLWLAYQSHHSQAAARDSAQRIWQQIQSRAAAGLTGGEAADEAQAQENFYERQERADAALAEVFEAEGRLRRLLGLPSSGDRVLWPANEPVLAEVIVDWPSSLAEALPVRSELRRQKLQIHSLELQLLAAKSLAHPQLDFVSGVQVNGLGDQLGGSSAASNAGGGFGSLLNPDDLGWNAGIEFSMPFGFRLEHARIRNIELQLAKARAVLAAQETEISHELSYAIRNLDRWYASVTATEKRRRAAARRLTAVQAEFDAGRSSLDRLLRSQVSLADAELAHFNSIGQYNKALVEFQYRKGSLLAQSDFVLADDEGLVTESILSPARN